MTAYLTEYFAEYLYGHHELLLMRATGTGLYASKPHVRYSMMTPVGAPSEPAIPNLGKNIFALKIFVPEKIKAGLQQRAALAEVTLGEFLRELICGHFFGCNIVTSNVGMISIGSSAAADIWELDDE